MTILDAQDPYPRNLVGYGANPPDPRWPGGARVALSFVLNYEEGAENTVLIGVVGRELRARLGELLGRGHEREALQEREPLKGRERAERRARVAEVKGARRRDEEAREEAWEEARKTRR
jgi:hypothetical protein